MRLQAHSWPFAGLALLILFPIAANTAVRSAETSATRPAAPALSATRQSGEAEAFVRSKVDVGFAILNDSAMSAEQRRAQFRDFLLSIVDSRRVAMFTLGAYARNAPPGEIDNFVKAYTNFSIALYQSYFDKYKGETLRVTGSTARSEDDVIVDVDVVPRDGAPQYKLAFRVRKDERGRHILTDVQIEGAWLVLNQRSDFSSYLQQRGGMLAPLSAELENRSRRIEERVRS